MVTFPVCEGVAGGRFAINNEVRVVMLAAILRPFDLCGTQHLEELDMVPISVTRGPTG